MSNGQYNPAWEAQTRNDNQRSDLRRLQQKLTSARLLLDEVRTDAGFRNLCEPLQDRIIEELDNG